MTGFGCSTARKGLLVLPVLMAVWLVAPVIHAQDNQGTGDIAGNAADLADSNVFTLNTTTLALVKRAFDAAGNPIATDSTLPKGSTVKFMIYVNNNTSVAVNDLSVQDVLDSTSPGVFLYQTDTIKVDNTVANCAAATCDATEEAAIFAAVDDNTALTDDVDTDVASYDAGTTTIHAGDQNVGNATVNVAANTVWVISFTVTMQ